MEATIIERLLEHGPWAIVCFWLLHQHFTREKVAVEAVKSSVELSAGLGAVLAKANESAERNERVALQLTSALRELGKAGGETP